ncbi:MAG: hypothetical protein JSW12_21120 [Deltaproteobacteria bacterium]|nr:MAG: hypothetical protein JSW12_21120 [Deltaproteobacteria bacterium]
MEFLGLKVFAWVGVLIFILLVFQFLTGKRILKIGLKYHRYNGILILTIGFLKGLFGILVSLL